MGKLPRSLKSPKPKAINANAAGKFYQKYQKRQAICANAAPMLYQQRAKLNNKKQGFESLQDLEEFFDREDVKHMIGEKKYERIREFWIRHYRGNVLSETTHGHQ